MSALISTEQVQQKILLLRGEKVMLDSDLAELYGVEVKQLKRQVRRNRNRFPADFMFELSRDEHTALRRHFGTLKGRAQGHSVDIMSYLTYSAKQDGRHW
jgi:hypothetical protein